VTAVSGGRLAALLRPASVVLVGATDHSGFSWAVYRNLARCGSRIRVHLVNRRGVPAHGRPAAASCAALPEPADLAFVMVPQPAVLAALADAAAAGIRNVAVLSSGYAEAGAAGRKAQQELVARARELGVLLLGPNHLGFANLVDRIAVTAIPGLPGPSGPLALVSQSGMSGGALAEFATMTGAGLSYLVTLGNEAMVTAGDVLGFLAADPHTRAVAMFLETVRRPARFAAAARAAAAAGKPVVVLKAGRSRLSARAAAAHTGAAPGDDRSVTAWLSGLGVIQVSSVEDLVVTAAAAAQVGRLARPGIGVVSISGGACDLLADHAADAGAELPALAPVTRAALARILPGFATVQNPLDVTGAAVTNPRIFTEAIEIMSADPAVGVVAVVNALPWRPEPGRWPGQPLADAIGAGAARSRVPVVHLTQAVQPVTGYTRRVMARAGIPFTLPGLRPAAVALRNLGWWSAAAGTRHLVAPGRASGPGTTRG
jgi:acyl-CoA synthetase (NDP forming)